MEPKESWGLISTNSNSTQSSFILSSGGNSIQKVEKVKLFGLIKLWDKITEMSVEEFFDKAKYSKKQIEVFDDVVDKYLSQIKKAQELGQVALVEKMQDDIEVVKKEAISAVFGVTDYLEKEQLDKLLAKSDKNIAITNIANYIRPIPDKVAKKLAKLRKENVFDDYVVAHYDPKKEAQQMTKKEVEKAKDPILFGKINGSSNFYFIGDWIDEFCNLTLKEAVVIIEDKAKSIIETKNK